MCIQIVLKRFAFCDLHLGKLLEVLLRHFPALNRHCIFLVVQAGGIGKVERAGPDECIAEDTKLIVHERPSSAFSLLALPNKNGYPRFGKFTQRSARSQRSRIDNDFDEYSPFLSAHQSCCNFLVPQTIDRHLDAALFAIDQVNQSIGHLVALRKKSLALCRVGTKDSRRTQKEDAEFDHHGYILSMRRIIYYDTETTGVRSDKDRIIEIAAFDPKEERSFVQLVNPQCPIPPEATSIHNISDEMVASAAPFADVGQEFAAFCGEGAILVAHNNDSFDKLFLEAEFKRSGLIIPPWSYIDSLKWSRKYRSDLPRHSLQHLREVYGITANNAHRALDDVMVLYQVFSRMIDDLPPDLVMQLLEAPQNVSVMPFGKHQGKPLSQVPKDYIRWLAESGSLDKPQNRELKTTLEKLALI